MKLRPYQEKALELIGAQFDEVPSTLMCMPTGCLSGLTIVGFNRAYKGYSRSMEQEYLCQSDKHRDGEIQTFVRSYCKDYVQLNQTVNGVIYSGKKITHTIKLKNGKSLRATSDHLILTENGYIALASLSGKDRVLCEAQEKKRAYAPKRNYRQVQGLIYHRFAGGAGTYRHKGNHVEGRLFRVPYHRLVYEAALNNLEVEELIRYCRESEEKTRELVLFDPRIYAVHHVNNDHTDNRLENLQLLSHEDHGRIEGVDRKFKNFGFGEIESSTVESIRVFGIEDTFDIACYEPNNNFVANGIVVHNCGKTVAFTQLIMKNLPKRAMIVAHRQELVYQAMDHLNRLGIDAHIEMADERASTSLWGRPPVVVASVQTLCAGNDGGRMTKFDPKEFSLLILDECHHATADTWRRAIDHFRQNPDLKVLGVTATPDRADEEALGQVFESVAFNYEVLDAIKDGWLVPIEQQMVTILDLDFSHIRTTLGDLNGADLAEVMETEKNLHGVASSTIEIIGNKRTLLFAVTVKQAEKYAEIFNRHRENMAECISADTPKQQRWDVLKRFASGETQVIANVGVLTEGYDNPAIEVIAMARPTKSRCLYAQCIGRGTRPMEKDGRSIVDAFPTRESRCEAIRMSAKPSLLVIDFVGNSGKHKLITSADLLGGNFTDDVIARATAKATKEGKPVRMDELLESELERMRQEKEERDRREAARKARLVGKATFTKVSVDPFNVFDLTPGRERGWEKGKTFSEKQANLLRKQGIDPKAISYHEGQQLIGEFVRRWKNHLCTLKQCALLKKYGYDPHDITMVEAGKIIDQLARNGWRRPVVV